MELRAIYQETLKKLMKDNEKVVMLDADLASASGSTNTFIEFPNQTINVGISEANMISSAAGMSLVGLKPYVHTFAPFATRRVADQVFMSAAYSRNPIHIYGSDPGFWAQHNGGTHTSYEDMAIMSSYPEVVVSAPSDPYQFAWILKEFLNRKNVFYTRAPRKEVPKLYKESTTFEFGKSILLHEGSKVAIFAIGEMVHEAVKARDLLKEQGLDVTVVDVFFLKPFDKEMLLNIAKSHDFIITIENHNKIGGLGSTIARELALSNSRVKFDMIAVNDVFGEVGEAPYLQNKHRLNAEHLIEKINKYLNK